MGAQVNRAALLCSVPTGEEAFLRNIIFGNFWHLTSTIWWNLSLHRIGLDWKIVQYEVLSDLHGSPFGFHTYPCHWDLWSLWMDWWTEMRNCPTWSLWSHWYFILSRYVLLSQSIVFIKSSGKRESCKRVNELVCETVPRRVYRGTSQTCDFDYAAYAAASRRGEAAWARLILHHLKFETSWMLNDPTMTQLHLYF